MGVVTSSLGRVFARLRRNAYTGSNRCWPCTVLNVGLLGVAVAVVTWALGGLGAIAGATLAVGGVAAIWLRGYLVPYTPRITAGMLPLLPGDRFAHAPPASPGGGTDDSTVADGGSGGAPGADGGSGATSGTGASAPGDETDQGVDVVADLVDAGVLVADGEALGLDPGFREAWRATVADGRAGDGGAEALADGLAAAVPWVASASVVTDEGREWIRLQDEDERIASETWLSVPAAAADLSAVRTLAEWTDLDDRRRTLAAPPLRQFLERCPRCDTRLEVSTPQACCGSPRYVAEGVEAVLACPSCDELVTVFEDAPEGA